MEAVRMKLARLSLVVGMAIGLSTMSFAQYGGSGTGSTGTSSGTYTPPSGGYSSTTGIAAGAGAGAGLALLYVTLHNRGTMVGCVATGDDGALKLVSSGKRDAYVLMGLSAVQPGTKIRVKGKRQTDGSGEKAFLASKLVKEYGPCEK
jgi:hypothetical protein